MHCKEFLSSFLFAAAFFIEQFKDQSGSKSSPGKKAERLFPLFAHIVFPGEQPPLVIQCADGGFAFSGGTVLFRKIIVHYLR